jgi:hypothetical protein
MGEPKPLASLTSGLLARKGAARPAMRRQPLGSGPASSGVGGYDDLGWNDMGYDVNPEQPIENAVRVDLKPLMAESMPAHNFDAETAVDADVATEVVTALPWAESDALDEPAAKPEVVRQIEALQSRVELPVEAAAPAPVAAPTAKAPVRRAAVKRASKEAHQRDKAAFTLRLDAERHLRLRLASAIYNKSSQQILIDVLDNYLAALPEIGAMASRLPVAPAIGKSTFSTSDGE